VIDPGRLIPNAVVFWNPSLGDVFAFVVDPKDIHIRAGPIGDLEFDRDPSPPGAWSVRRDRHDGRIFVRKRIDPVQGGFDLVPVEESVHSGVVLLIIVVVVVVRINILCIVAMVVFVVVRSKGDVGGSSSGGGTSGGGGSAPLNDGSGRGGVSGGGGVSSGDGDGGGGGGCRRWWRIGSR
jgi:hypothetical protein